MGDIRPASAMDSSTNRRSDSIPGPSFSTLIDGAARQQRRHFRRRKSSLRRRFPNRDTIPGSSGTDFPDYTSIPLTSFTCLDGGRGQTAGTRQPGYYADVETKCQVKGTSF